MMYIALAAVLVVLLLQFTGSIPQSSVGGPMTIAFVLFIAVLAFGIYESWTKKRRVLGWIVSIFIALAGAYIGAEIGNLLMGGALLLVGFEGSLAASKHPLLYVSLVGMMLFPLLGSWVALRIADRFR